MSSHLHQDLARSFSALTVVGREVLVDCVDGTRRRYVNLDPAASTPSLQRVWDAIGEFLPWYSSVHRGAGMKSQVSTAAFEGAREAVRSFLEADEDQEVIFVGNTTHATNMLAALYPHGTSVLSSPVEHHANMLPWRRHDVELLPFTTSPEKLLVATREALERGRGRFRLLAISGASNVTGEIPPIAELAALAHSFDAEIFVDAAQLAPHRPISMRSLGIDHLALSGHKLYAPFGAGALVARKDRLNGSGTWVKGGGAVKFVMLDDVTWADSPDRHEAGSPNTIGAIALGVACDLLSAVGMDAVAQHELELSDRLHQGLAQIPGVRSLHMWSERTCDRVGVATFTMEGYRDRLLAQILASEHAIGVRNGCFCAHPLVTDLLGIDAETAACIRRDVIAGDESRMPGAVRASVGLANDAEDIDRLLAALESIAEFGPAAHYVYDSRANEYRPTHDRRSWPTLRARLDSVPPTIACGAN